MATKRQTVVGIFEDHHQAQQAVNELKRAGFSDAQIGVAGRNYDASGTLTRDGDDQDSYAGEGAAAGLAAGAGVGALWGLGILSGVMPVIGPAIAGGTLGVILSSAAAGAAAAGLTGALVGMGIPKDEAEFYESEFRSGRTIVTVACNGRESEATSLLRRFGGYDISSRGDRTGAMGSSAMEKTSTGKSKTLSGESTRHATTSAHGQECVTAHEEQLHVRKQPVETGEVKVRKEVHTEHKTIDVPVEREEVVIERRRGAGGQPTREGIHAGEEIRVPIREEQVKVEKQTVAKEQVSVGKRKVHETERVEGDVRKEDIKVETEGNARVRDNRGKK
jgi:uncharacterized protein (TIGR02271 family)